MKKFAFQFTLVLAMLVAAAANAQTVVTVTGEITSNTTWTNNNIYLLEGYVYVKNNATLTIQPGTLIKGDLDSKGTLIVARGAKIIADGTKSQPIVFTSNQDNSDERTYGDWGGVIVLGNAPINQTGGEAEIEGGVQNTAGDATYGGNDPNDNSGILRYVRIEFGGVAFEPNNEINGLTLGGVGRGTTIDYVQVSYTGDDGIECFGGTVNMKHLVLTNNLDDDLDTDNGYSGNVQFVLVTRDPNVADAAGDSNGFESDNDATSSDATPRTHPIYSNITVVGPLETSSTAISSYYKRGARLRRNTATSIYNSLIMGYPVGLMVEGTASEANATSDLLQVQNTVLAGNTVPLAVASASTWDIANWFNNAAFNNHILANTSDAMLTSAYAATPNALPTAGSPLLTGSSFTNSNLSDPFFEQVAYRGAFGAENWTECWTEWDPMNATYSGAISYPVPTAQFTFAQTGNAYMFTNMSTNSLLHWWDFGVAGATSTEANPTYTYPSAGTYTITLISSGACGSDTMTQTVTTLNVKEIGESMHAALYPNPANTLATLTFRTSGARNVTVELMDATGRSLATLLSETLQAGSHEVPINAENLTDGMYFVNIRSEKGTTALPLSVTR